jgi:tetratricopeptide (TPR) repeat protein
VNPRDAIRAAREQRDMFIQTSNADDEPLVPGDALSGELAVIRGLLAKKANVQALARARAWHDREPGDILAIVGLGDSLVANGDLRAAARFTGSIIDLYPGRADLRRFAGERLSALAVAKDLAVDTFRRAVADRPDHLSGHRLLAYALLRAGKPADAFAAALAGLDLSYPDGRFAGGLIVLAEDAQMIGAVYARAVPAARDAIRTALAARDLVLATGASTRFVVSWETDSNDVDLHVTDAKHHHAYYERPEMATGGRLYADVTTGYGPECFAIRGKPTAGPYRLALHYFAKGPMGYGMGTLQVIRFDGAQLVVEDRPFVIMNEHAAVDLGTVR